MAKMKHHPTSYGAAAAILGDRTSVKLGNNTWLEATHEDIGVRLHNTFVVRFHADGRVTLWTGGYRTVTTKDRINEFITGRVYQKNHEWFYVGHGLNGALAWDAPDDFIEGMNINHRE